MIKFSVCLDTIFNDLPLEEAATKAAACGASAIQFRDWADRNLDTIARVKEAVGVHVSLLPGLKRTSPNDPATTEAAAAELLESVNAARQIGASGLFIAPGRDLEGVTRTEQYNAIAQVLSAAAEAAEESHVDLLLGSHSLWEKTLLPTAGELAALLERIGRSNVKMLFDPYRQLALGGNPTHLAETYFPRIGHFRLSQAPETELLDLRELLHLIDSLGYQDFVGLEFRPRTEHAEAVKNVIHLV